MAIDAHFGAHDGVFEFAQPRRQVGEMFFAAFAIGIGVGADAGAALGVGEADNSEHVHGEDGDRDQQETDPEETGGDYFLLRGV